MGKSSTFEVFLETATTELQTLRGMSSHAEFARSRLLSRLRKKAALDSPSLKSAAVEKFLAVNNKLHDYQHSIDSSIVSNARAFVQRTLERTTDRLFPGNVFPQETLELSYVFDNWRFGPGASNGIKGSHAAEKISSAMTCTARSEPLVRILRSYHPYLSSTDAGTKTRGTLEIRGSRLSTVPKNEDVVRTIAIEPSGNMCLQLAAGKYLEEALRSCGLDIRCQQPKNRAMARLGSLDNSFATIDLSSASDMITPSLVQALLPSRWFNLISELRSPEIEANGTWHTLNMVSTMGNGFTFPLMTLVISALIYGFRCTRGGPSNFIDWSTAAVFGDDIILPSSEARAFSAVLESAGFVVNHEKSFYDGPFKESCGGDYYDGVDVTPVYVKPFSTESSLYVAINQILEWSGRHFFLPNTISYLISLLHNDPLLIPEWHNPDEGILCNSGPRRYKYLKTIARHKPYLGRYEMCLAVGGYLNDRNNRLFYSPRTNSVRKSACMSRIPKGFRDGWDAVKRPRQLSDRVSFILSLLIS